jgi:hypothetical protein
MATLAKFLTEAILKVSTDETYSTMEFATREEARENFTAALLFELGLGPKPSAAHAAAAVPTEEVKARKAPKKKAAAVDALAEQLGQLAITEAKSEDTLKADEPKAKKAKKTKAVEVPEVVPAANAGAAPEAPKKKPGPKPKAKAEGGGNIEKLTPTHKKHLKAVAAELKVEPKEKEFLAYANEMTAEEWGAKSLDDHLRLFLQPEGAPALAPPPKEFLEVEFNGKDYLVDPETKFIYTATDGAIKARTHVGVVGMLEFAEMEV